MPLRTECIECLDYAPLRAKGVVVEVLFLVAVHHCRGWWVSSLGEVSRGEIRKSSACLAELTSTLSLPVVEQFESRFVVSPSCPSFDVRKTSSVWLSLRASASKSGNRLLV